MSDTSRNIVAFSPSDADHAKDGYVWTVYNPTYPNPYNVRDAATKIQQVMDRIDPDEYDLEDGEWWVRLDHQSVLNGDPERVDRD